jgi:hypothetical protein
MQPMNPPSPPTEHKQPAPIQPRAGRDREWGRFDLPVIRPSTTRAKLARKLV